MDGTVLIADDDRTIRTVLTQALTRAGCRVHATGSLAQLSRWVEEGRGDLVITDVTLPGMSGLELLRLTRSSNESLPVILLGEEWDVSNAVAAMREALPVFGRKIRGYDMADAVMTGIETRTSSPLRITRGEDCQSLNVAGLYPAGEGAGYAGGILSAGVDGIKVAEAIARAAVGAPEPA